MKYILGVLGVILVAVIAIVFVTRPRGVDETPPTEQEQAVDLNDKAFEGTIAEYTEQGELVGENQRRAIRIKVSEKERRLEILKGYNEAVIRAHTYPNTPAAYRNFLAALQDLGFSEEDKDEDAKEDDRGACPTGKTYIYEFKEFSQTVSRLWNSTCGSDGSNYGGKVSTTRQVFEMQIPEYDDLTKDVDLSP